MKVHMSFIHLSILFAINCKNTNDKDINDCQPDPCTHGSCTDEVNLYTCACDPGYTGKKCAEGTNALHSYI